MTHIKMKIKIETKLSMALHLAAGAELIPVAGRHQWVLFMGAACTPIQTSTWVLYLLSLFCFVTETGRKKKTHCVNHARAERE